MKTPILKKEIIKIFQKYGLSKDHALISANALINAELVGALLEGKSRPEKGIVSYDEWLKIENN